ncbi:type VI secretion system protein TssA [Marinicellulosiphila megalodicopiae]|uniref:type VI secretion system protein TssA n=1 Tax=Marinicellulosiphila megalodicopiae TaxID=2724896 RepID=UPI003BB030D6
MSIESLELQGVGTQPISSEQPCGDSIRYEPEFQKLESEIAKLESLSSETTDWREVEQISVDILKNKSKDIAVAVYLAQALLQNYGIKGLASGLDVLNQLVSTHWQQMHPPVKRLRARASVLQWLSEKTDFLLESITVDADNAHYFVLASQNFNNLIDALESNIDGEAPGMLELHKRLRDANREAKQYAVDSSVSQEPVAKVEVQTESIVEEVAEVSLPSVEQAESETQVEESISILSGHELEKLGSNPISDESACGVVAKYEPDFEALEAELAKQESVTAATVDWRDVCQYGVNLLTNQTKDLLVCAYLSKGLIETQGYFGLTLSLKIVKDIIETHWDEMYPPLKRIRAREAALNWLSEKTGDYIVLNKPKQSDYSAVLESYELLSDITSLLEQKIEGGGPSMLELSKPLRDYRKEAVFHFESQVKKEEKPKPLAAAPVKNEVIKEVKKEAPVSAAVQKTESTRNDSAARKAITNVTNGPVTSDNEAKKSLRSIQEAARTTGGFYLDQQKTNAKSYRINRVSTWLMVDQAPPSKDGITQLPSAPVADKRKQLETLFEANKFEELLPQLEQTLTRAPFWLDGQYLAAKSLQVLGDKFQEAYECVVRETRNFLERAEGIEYLKFSDGVAFANEQTLRWITSEVMISKSQGDSEGETPWDECLLQAKVLFSSKKTTEALELFNQGINSAPTLRLNWQWRLALADLLEQSDRVSMAVPILQSLTQELETSNVLKWDSSLSKKVAIKLYHCANKLFNSNKKDLTMLDVRQYAYQILCLVDPITSIKLQEGKNG